MPVPKLTMSEGEPDGAVKEETAPQSIDKQALKPDHVKAAKPRFDYQQYKSISENHPSSINTSLFDG